jgi:polyisoprenyl-phosphate glycosyltransferase
MPPQINIIVPLYNEAKVFGDLIARLKKVLDETSLLVSVIMVDDGSKDNTPLLMQTLAENDKRFVAVFLSRNFGHQYALSAGLSVVDATDGVFIIDGDLQDPPELLEAFYKRLKEGNDVVYAIRKNRKESWLKKTLYKFFYKLLQNISYIQIPLDSGDFCMISARVAKLLNENREESRFLRGIRTWVGFKQIGVEYNREERFAGDSKYTFKMLFKLAFNGIFNFSELPIKWITRLGAMTILSSGLYLLYTVYLRIFHKIVPEGFTALLFTIILFGGVQLLSIGIIGEYILRIFFQVKNRPLFVIDRVVRVEDI